ncbi:MAG: four helix bundle protein [Pirellulales bacterium]|nr:four helix bundle protein [Pirellulales bacterium]
MRRQWTVGSGQWAVGSEKKFSTIIQKWGDLIVAVRNFKDLIAWQKAMDFTERVYRETACFPREEIYGLRAQVRGSASSVPSNIAEGQGRNTTKEFRHFLSIAHGSLCESQTQLLLALRLKYITDRATSELIKHAEEVARLINGLSNSLKQKTTPKK